MPNACYSTKANYEQKLTNNRDAISTEPYVLDSKPLVTTANPSNQTLIEDERSQTIRSTETHCKGSRIYEIRIYQC
jgi:hypothetical protein